jgi:signal peptidase II
VFLSRKFRLLILLLVLGCTVGCDQASKQMARVELQQRGSVALPGGLGEFRLAENSGSFLSFGGSLPVAFRFALLTVGVGIALLGLLVYLARSTQLDCFSFMGLALAWAGGTSNLIDRITRDGRVTDFVLLRVGPLHTGVFNAADVVIMLGMTILLYGLWKTNRRQAQLRQ